MDRAVISLRVLQDGPPKSGVRIIGQVFESYFAASSPARGVNVRIAGPNGDVVLATDDQGIYDITGLPPGHYSVGVGSREAIWTGELKTGEIGGTDTYQ